MRDIVVVVLPSNGLCTSRNVVVDIFVFDVIQHTEGVDICRDGCCWCGGVLVGLVDVEDIVVLPS